MIDRHIVFVLGAGASWDYGFPLGTGLRKDVIRELRTEPSTLRTAAYGAGFSDDEIRSFLEKFDGSQIYSIDLFLNRHAKFMRLGKFLIAWSIQNYERKSNFQESRPNVAPWFQELFNRLIHDGYFERRQTWIRILTFNYDRSLEEFLYRALRDATPHDDPSYVGDLLKHIPVTHAYGSLGTPIWDKPDARPYGYGAYSPTELLKLSEDIHIVFAAPEPRSEWHTGLKALQNAQVVAFMGFGFAPENISRLKLPDTPGKDAHIYATVKDVGRAKRVEIENLLSNNQGVVVADTDCYGLLNDFPILD